MNEIVAGREIVTFVVKDLARARRFYVDQLELRVEEEQSGRFVMVKVGSLRLCIDVEDKSGEARGGGANLIVNVKDLAKAATDLEQKKVAFERHKGSRGREYIELRDPEGYKLILSEGA